jgi:hypothetical protein
MQDADEAIDAVHAEQVRATYQQVPIAIVVNVVNAGITATIVASSAPTKLALLWFCAVTLVSIGRWLLWRRYQRATPQAQNVRVWGILVFSPERFALQDTHYHHDTITPGLGYGHKLWIVLRNQSGAELIVNPASWETSVGDIAVLPLAKHPWTPEGTGGWENNSWSWPRRERELEPIHVYRGGVIQTYVPLPGPLNGGDVELRRRIVSKRLGTLIIPFSMDGQQLSETKKL